MPSAQQQIISLPYFKDSAVLFAPIAGQPWSVFLDSGYFSQRHGRYDIIAADPICTLLTSGNTTVIERQGKQEQSTDDPFALIKNELINDFPAIDDLPFNGGAIGYFSYDLARQLEKLPAMARDAENIPDLAVAIYQWALVVDHHQQKSFLVGSHPETEQWLALQNQFSQLPQITAESSFEITSAVKSNMDKAFYQQAFDKIKSYLIEGDCYQVNLAQRFEANCKGDPWTAYEYLRKINSAPFSCYLNTPQVQVLSSSPERFLKVIDGKVETKPIKGTRAKKTDQAEDQQQIKALQNSKKDRAENLMIVDLLRNDISKNCCSSSVKVPKLFAVESYATVHHLVSTVTGVLGKGQHALDLLKSCFPGGSITGAPKIRAMEIIEELEPNRRGIYCGSVAYIGFNGNMDSSITIRTLVHSDSRIRFWAGGGIVNDSVMEDEYQECFDKALAMQRLLAYFTSK